jgi:HK97 family phage major capsid protein
MQCKVIKPWDHYKAGQVLDLDDTEARFAISTGQVIPAHPADIKAQYFAGNEPSFGLFVKSLAAGASDEHLARFYGGPVQKAAMTSVSGSQGGYVIPQTFALRLLAAGEPGFIRPRATVIPSASAELLVPTIDTTTAQAAGTTPFFGGLLLKWTEEGQTFAESEQAYKQLSLKLNFLGGSVTVSLPWLQDQHPATADAVLTALFARALAWYEDYAFLRGTGVGQPLGILNAACTINVARQVASHVQYTDLATMLSKLLPESINRACWLFNPTAQTDLLQLKDGAGRAALLQVGATPQGYAQWAMLGLPAYPTEKLPALGTAGDVLLVDPTFYVIADHVAQMDPNAGPGVGLAVAFSAHASFTTFTKNQGVFLIAKRLDGQPWLDKAVTLQAGSTQVSPFVALQ